MKVWLLWLETWFRQQRDVTACLVTSALPVPLFMMFIMMPFLAMADKEYQNIYNWDAVPFTQIVVVLCTFLLSGVAVFCWSRRTSEEDYPLLSFFTVTVMFCAVTALGLGYGYKDSPIMLLALGMVVLVRALFKPEIYKPICILMLVLFVCSEIGFWTKSIPYAPMLQSPIFTGVALDSWWAFWLRIIYSMIAIPMVVMFFVLAYFMNREKLELERLVVTDSLTGIANRSHFMAQLDMESRRHVRKQQSMCLLMCDVDYFKRINDAWGHPAGDEVLQAVGRILSQSTRAAGDVVARFGGEEFVVLLPHTKLGQAEKVAEKIRKYLSHHIFGEGERSFQVTMSIGVVQVSDGDGERALKAADDNMYRAKQAGRDRVVSSVAMRQGSLESVSI